MRSILSGFLKLTRKNCLPYLSRRCIHEFDFEGKEEILENYLGNIKLIGINLPDSKNILTESALDKLCNSLKDFYINDKLLVAILHSSGGNFCPGVVQTEEAFKKCQELIKVLHKGNKPVLASLKGYTTDFGFQIAIMCDLKVIEEGGVVGFGFRNGKTEISDIVYNKLFDSVGVSRAALVVLTNVLWSTSNALESGFVNEISQCGCGLGILVAWAQSIAMSPTSEVMRKKAVLNSHVKDV